MMNPDIFFSQEDAYFLVQVFMVLACEVATTDDRRDLLINSGLHNAFLSKLNLNASPYLFANQLVALCREYRVSELQPAYHPIIRLLEYLLQVHELDDQVRTFFQRLVKRGQQNFKGLVACQTVGRIEAPLNGAIGTGVLVEKHLLLTCKHVVERIIDHKQDHAWIRFGYKIGKYGVESGTVFELDIKDIVCQGVSIDAGQDYALIRIKGVPEQPIANLFNGIPYPTQSIRLIHYPRGAPVCISDPAEIIQVDNETLRHNIQTDFGSSGGPIFDENWQVLAIHRGVPSSSHAYGVTEAVLLFSIWNNIRPYLLLQEGATYRQA